VKHLRTLVAAAILAASPVQLVRAAPSPPQFVTLGTAGGPVIRTKRSEPANAFVVDGAAYLFDVGDGVQRQLAAAGLPLAQVRAVFISHHHMDHNAGLGPLLMSHWLFDPKPALPVIGPPGTQAMVHGLALANVATANAPVTIGGPPSPSIESTATATDLPAVLGAPTEIYRDDKVRVLAISVDHFHLPPGTAGDPAPRAYAFRIETPGRVVVYSGDTGPSANLVRLAKGADLLVCEVIDLGRVEAALGRRPGMTADALAAFMAHMRQDHLTPEAIGALARDAGVKAVVLTHLSPGEDGETDMSGYTRGIAPAFTGPVMVAKDLDRF
jgi:ribonuclease BN (tRNA processing enzyme)